MRKKVHVPIPVQRALRKLGNDISTARRRRRITMKLMAERSGISRITLSRIENGDPSVSMAAYASALFVLGMTEHLARIADPSQDITGRELEEERLPRRVRYPQLGTGNDNE